MQNMDEKEVLLDYFELGVMQFWEEAALRLLQAQHDAILDWELASLQILQTQHGAEPECERAAIGLLATLYYAIQGEDAALGLIQTWHDVISGAEEATNFIYSNLVTTTTILPFFKTNWLDDAQNLSGLFASSLHKILKSLSK